MSSLTNRPLLTSLAVLSDYCRGSRPSASDLDELRQFASDSENLLPPDELACLLVQRELDEFRASRGLTPLGRTAALARHA